MAPGDLGGVGPEARSVRVSAPFVVKNLCRPMSFNVNVVEFRIIKLALMPAHHPRRQGSEFDLLPFMDNSAERLEFDKPIK